MSEYKDCANKGNKMEAILKAKQETTIALKEE